MEGGLLPPTLLYVHISRRMEEARAWVLVAAAYACALRGVRSRWLVARVAIRCERTHPPSACPRMLAVIYLICCIEQCHMTHHSVGSHHVSLPMRLGCMAFGLPYYAIVVSPFHLAC